MSQNRRSFLANPVLSLGAFTIGSRTNTHLDEVSYSALDTLRPMNNDVVPISVAERKERIAKAQELMARQKMDAIFIEGTVSCYYFTGMKWGQSERTFGVVIPAKGDLVYICPKFEEDRALELIQPEFGKEPHSPLCDQACLKMNFQITLVQHLENLALVVERW